MVGKAREEQKGDRAKKKKKKTRAGVLNATWAAAGVLFYLAVERKRREGSALSPLCPLRPPQNPVLCPHPLPYPYPRSPPLYLTFLSAQLEHVHPGEDHLVGLRQRGPCGGTAAAQRGAPTASRSTPGARQHGALIVFLGRFMQFLSSLGTRSGGDGCQPRARLLSLAASP